MTPTRLTITDDVSRVNIPAAINRAIETLFTLGGVYVKAHDHSALRKSFEGFFNTNRCVSAFIRITCEDHRVIAEAETEGRKSIVWELQNS